MPIVAIGGGEMRTGQTLSIDREIVRLTGKLNPNALFIPTASGDPAEYCEAFELEFGGRLGCKTDSLFLVREDPGIEEIRKRILNSDLVYVGGGSTLNLMRIWRKRGVDAVMREALAKGVVLSGVSAGANCWFQHAHSDSASFYKKPRPGYYMRVSCLGFVKGTYCPHVIGEGRLDNFRSMITRYGGPGYAVNDCGAILIEDAKMRPLRCDTGVVIKRLTRRSGHLREVDL